MALRLLLFVQGAWGFRGAAPRRAARVALGATVSERLASAGAAVDDLAARTADCREGAADLLPCGDDAAGLRTWLLRFVEAEGDVEAAEARVRASVAWRRGDGLAIVNAARDAVAAATATAGAWDNGPVLAAAPHSARVAPHVDGGKCLTLRNRGGDGLIYAIRAGSIDDGALMATVAPDELCEFFLYAKAVNEIVAAQLSARTGELATVVTVNDLKGVDLFGDASFRNALSAASKQGDAVFPGLTGPTVLLNLPRLLGALVKLFTPLFPPAVRKKIKFDGFDLGAVDALTTPDGKARLYDFLDGALADS